MSRLSHSWQIFIDFADVLRYIFVLEAWMKVLFDEEYNSGFDANVVFLF